ncbi:hypothetical protein [Herpetosiphon geysericola]|uniref:Uncharacterized protein n=1 Tax=Herpetosiphon geysericola TaxID=70996 RepID=A0A0P6YTB2_9CHLR|nr:hypothetical protein [Herpetosiphon geysericola]KPL86723.1 hypothetical protein SE18_12180 [Herpetosiphon geysericola]
MSEQTDAPKPIVIKQKRGCLATLVGSALTIIVSAGLGAALALLVMWYGPRNVGVSFPDSTGRIGALEQAQQTAIIVQTDQAATLRGLTDLRGSVDGLRERVQTLESSLNTRETNLDSLQKQIDSNLNSLLSIQSRLNELESIPANAALTNRLDSVEQDLVSIGSTLERLRIALGAAAPTASPQPTATPTR